MGRVSITNLIDAPRDVCFDLSRSVEAHIQSTPGTAERAVGGVTTGLLGSGDQVTWDAVHLGRRRRMTVGITVLNRPDYFVDEMIAGPFRSFRHFHGFQQERTGTRMIDIMSYTVPAGWLGRLIDRLILESYMRHLLVQRVAVLKSIAEHRQ